jgi:hypothetical protein
VRYMGTTVAYRSTKPINIIIRVSILVVYSSPDKRVSKHINISNNEEISTEK